MGVNINCIDEASELTTGNNLVNPGFRGMQNIIVQISSVAIF